MNLDALIKRLDSIEALEGETAVCYYLTSTPISVVVTKLDDPKVFELETGRVVSVGYRIRGLDTDRGEFYLDGFWACLSFQLAIGWARESLAIISQMIGQPMVFRQYIPNDAVI